MQLVNAEYKTCLLTIVEPGSSDKVIKIWPAMHESEKIWTDNARGLDRYNAVKRLLNNHAPRGAAVPEPKPWHSNPKDLRTPDLKPEDIPIVRLDGAVFEPLPEEKRPEYKKPDEAMNKRMDHLENMVGSLAASISSLTSAFERTAGSLPQQLPTQGIPSEPETKRRGRPKKVNNELHDAAGGGSR